MAEYAFDIYPANDPFGKISTSLEAARLVRMTVADQLEDAEFWPSLYGAGKGFIEIHGDHPDAQHLQRRGWVAVVRIDTTPDRYIGGFFLDEGDFKALSRQEQSGRVLHFGGAGGLSYFDRYRLINFVYAPGQTHRGSYDVPGKWTWDDIAPGGILVRLLEEGFNAPAPAPYAAFNWEFTRAIDSNGNAWLEAGDYQVDIGTGGSQVVADQIRRGVVVQVDYSLAVQAYRDISEFRTDRTSATFASGKVRFEAGVNILNDLPKRVAAKRERTHVLMRGKEGNYVLVDEDTELNPLNLGEPYYDFLQDDTTSAVSTLTRKGQVYLERLRDTSDQCEVEHLIGPGGADGEEGYDPGPDGDYWLGDLVTVHTGSSDFDYDEQSIEVASIRYFLRDGKWVARASLGAQYTDSRSLGAQQQSAISSIIQQLITDVQRCEPDQLLDSGIQIIGHKVLTWPGGGADLTGSIADLEALGAEGDIYIADASRDAGNPSSHIPAPPGSWNAIGSGGASGGALSGVSARFAWKAWVDGDLTVGSWPDTHFLIIYLLRGTLTADPIGGFSGVSHDSADINIPALTLEVSDGSSWVFAYGIHESENISDNGMTGTEPMTPGENAMAGQHGTWYSDGGVTAWGAHAISSTADDHVGHAFEIKAGGPAAILRDGHELLVGSAFPKVKRCDDTEHWHATGSDSPTVNDDRDAGFRLGTLWINDDGAAFFLVDTTAGAAVWIPLSGGVDLSGINFLVGTASGLLSAEIAVGTTPGGQLNGAGSTWASPVVANTHGASGVQTHHAESHNTRHQSGGADAVKLDDLAAPDDNTDLNASTSAHGLMQKYPGGTTDFLRADGTFATPPAGGGYTDEQAQDAVGAMVGDTATVDLTYVDATPLLKADVIPGGIKLDDLGTPDDNTDLNATTGLHGLLPKLGGGTTNFLRADGSWAAPPGGSHSTASAFATATTTISATTYADVTGASISLAAGTWLIMARFAGAASNAAFLMNCAITHSDNTVIVEGAQNVPASGSASVNSWGSVTLIGLVTPGSTTTYKLRAAKGNAAPTANWTAFDGAPPGQANNGGNNSDKATVILAVQIA